jgi:hypothetical protein
LKPRSGLITLNDTCGSFCKVYFNLVSWYSRQHYLGKQTLILFRILKAKSQAGISDPGKSDVGFKMEL